MKKILIALALVASVATAASNVVSKYVSADDKSIAMLVKYYPGVSTGSSATIAVVQGTSLTFQVGGAAYTGFECPVSGALGGIITESDSSCDTLGEIVDTINGTSETFATGFFRAVLVDGMRDDSADDLLADGGTQVTRSDGLPVYFDTSANFAVGEGRALVPESCRDDISCWVTPAGRILENPFANQQTTIQWVEGYSTYGSGDSYLYIYSVKPSNKAAGSEDVQTIWNEAMGASATNKQFTQFQYVNLPGRPHDKVIVRIVNSAAQASVRLLVSAKQTPLQ